jgi:subtilisin family serine protease
VIAGCVLPGAAGGVTAATRTAAGEAWPTTAPAAPAVAAAEWQWAAAGEADVPEAVRTAAARFTIAVIDTGADVTAPSLAAKTPITYDVVRHSPRVRDLTGHGTFVASLAAGAGEFAGFGGDARLMIVAASRGDTFTDADEAAAIVWAVDHGANIVNLSLAGTTTSPVERAAVAYAVRHRVLLVAAAGNDGAAGGTTVYPAALVGRNGLVVGAATATGVRATFSSAGRDVDVLAPGADVLGAIPTAASSRLFERASTPALTGLYGYGSGTSFAAPEVAGAAALVWAADPRLSPAGVAAVIERTASGRGAWSSESGYGDIDVAAAVALAHTLDPDAG